VLFVLTGSSAAGKSAVLPGLRSRVRALAVYDFDELGVPSDADETWRRRGNERWVRRALEHQAHGTDTLVAGRSPPAEWRAAPSAPRLDGIAACLIDVADDMRIARLAQRRARHGWPPEALVGELLAWAAWHREHADDALVLDTTHATVAETCDAIAAWIAGLRAAA